MLKDNNKATRTTGVVLVSLLFDFEHISHLVLDKDLDEYALATAA